MTRKDWQRTKKLQGLAENKEATSSGGQAAGAARVAYEKQTGVAVSTKTNYLEISEATHRKVLNR